MLNLFMFYIRSLGRCFCFCMYPNKGPSFNDHCNTLNLKTISMVNEVRLVDRAG